MTKTAQAAAVVGALLVERALVRRGKARWVAKNTDDAHKLVEETLPDARRLYRRMRRELSEHTHKLNLDGLPRPLRWLIGELLDAIANLTGDLARNVMGIDVWLPQMERELAKHAAAAWMAGKSSDELDRQALDKIASQVGTQIGFLRNFAVVMQSDEEFRSGYEERAESYANSIKEPYWNGKTEQIPLPAMPTQGTQCGSNCRCRWRIVPLDKAAGDFDAFWDLETASVGADGKPLEHCQTCLERSEQWKPIRIRDFVLED